MNGLIRGCGRALVLGGAAMILINVIATPLLPRAQGSAVVMSSGIFLVRQSASGLAALLLLFGCLGLHLAQRTAAGRFGAAAFVLTFVGGACLFAVEWANIFVLHALAQRSPETLAALDKNTLMNVGFASAAGLLAVGWLLLSVSLWRSNVLPRWAAATTFAGLFAIPALQAPLGLIGGIAGNVIFGVGLMGLGRALATGSSVIRLS
jgi:hypothetical protein